MKYVVTVKPGSSQERIIQTAPGELTIYLRAKPHDGEANEALIRLLAKKYNISKTSITIHRGLRSRTKIVEL